MYMPSVPWAALFIGCIYDLEMSFPEFYCTVKATGNRYDYINKAVTFNNIRAIILTKLPKGDISTVVLQMEA